MDEKEFYRRGIEVLTTKDGSKIEVKKGKFGYRIVHPVKTEDGKTLWINFLFGGWANFFKIIFYLLLIVIIYFGFSDVLNQCEVIMNSCNNSLVFP